MGANIQDAAFDVARLADRVTYLENGTTLDSQSLPIPTPRDTLPVDM